MAIIRTFKTPKGTELPLMNFKGKEYLEVKYRLIWFQEEKPNWSIRTECLSSNASEALFKASIYDDKGEWRATGHKTENKQGFADFIEKSETGAIGRALAIVGYGTQFAPEFDEGERIVDSPTPAKQVKNHAPGASNPPPVGKRPFKLQEPVKPESNPPKAKMTANQRKMIWALMTEKGWSKKNAEEFMIGRKKMLGVETANDFTMDQATEIIQLLKREPPIEKEKK